MEKVPIFSRIFSINPENWPGIPIFGIWIFGIPENSGIWIFGIQDSQTAGFSRIPGFSRSRTPPYCMPNIWNKANFKSKTASSIIFYVLALAENCPWWNMLILVKKISINITPISRLTRNLVAGKIRISVTVQMTKLTPNSPTW